ncbi:MAG: DUF370 domain-containing protein [Clostridia bacterium]
MKLINVGFGNMVSLNRIVSIISPDSSPVKRLVQESKEKGILIDATQGRKTRAVVITDSGYVVLSSILPETIANRVENGDNSISDRYEEEEK